MALTKIKIGDHFGRLTVIGFAGHSRTKSGKSKLLVKCKCSCGNVIITPSNNLITGDTKSCGCYSKDIARESHLGKSYNYKHGGTMYNSRLYKVFSAMHQRCENPNCDHYDRYGGRGIYICKEWSGENGFFNFREWAMNNGYNPDAPKGECTINRIDNDGPYSPDNCEWVNMKTQINNTSINRYITYNGETHTVSDWANILGIKFSTLENRLCNGWPIEKALSTKAEKNITFINYNGNNYSVAEWCYIFGLAQTTVSSRIERGATDPAKILKRPQKGCINAIYFVDENERPINQQDYADGIRIGRKAY